MASAQVVEMSVSNNSRSQDSNHPDDLFQSRYCMLMLGSNHFLINTVICHFTNIGQWLVCIYQLMHVGGKFEEHGRNITAKSL